MANGIGGAFSYGMPPEDLAQKRQQIAMLNQESMQREAAERARKANEMDTGDWLTKVVLPIAGGIAMGVTGGMAAPAFVKAAAPAIAGAAVPAAAGSAAAAGGAAATGGGIAAGLQGAATGLASGSGLGMIIDAMREKDARLGLSGLRTTAGGLASATEPKGAIGRWLPTSG